MTYTSLFIDVQDKKVLVIGSGEVGLRRAERFKREGAKVIIITENPSEELRKKGFYPHSKENIEEIVEISDIVIIASDDYKLNKKIAELAKGKIVNRADKPEKGNLIVPNSFYVGDVQISLYTGGKSPLMAKELRKKIQSIITEEDIIQIELQDYARNLLMEKVDNQKKRREYLYQILEDETIKTYIENKNIDSSKHYIKKFIQELD